jgi:hypothetical protein
MKILILLTMLLALTGCVSDQNKPKVYSRKIEFYKPEKLKVLYSMPKEKELPEEYYKTNFLDTKIAKLELETQKIRNFNKLAKASVKVAKEKLKIFQGFLAQKEAEISKREKQCQQIKEMEKELKAINKRIDNKVQAPCL